MTAFTDKNVYNLITGSLLNEPIDNVINGKTRMKLTGRGHFDNFFPSVLTRLLITPTNETAILVAVNMKMFKKFQKTRVYLTPTLINLPYR